MKYYASSQTLNDLFKSHSDWGYICPSIDGPTFYLNGIVFQCGIYPENQYDHDSTSMPYKISIVSMPVTVEYIIIYYELSCKDSGHLWKETVTFHKDDVKGWPKLLAKRADFAKLHGVSLIYYVNILAIKYKQPHKLVYNCINYTYSVSISSSSSRSSSYSDSDHISDDDVLNDNIESLNSILQSNHVSRSSKLGIGLRMSTTNIFDPNGYDHVLEAMHKLASYHEDKNEIKKIRTKKCMQRSDGTEYKNIAFMYRWIRNYLFDFSTVFMKDGFTRNYVFSNNFGHHNWCLRFECGSVEENKSNRISLQLIRLPARIGGIECKLRFKFKEFLGLTGLEEYNGFTDIWCRYENVYKFSYDHIYYHLSRIYDIRTHGCQVWVDIEIIKVYDLENNVVRSRDWERYGVVHT